MPQNKACSLLKLQIISFLNEFCGKSGLDIKTALEELMSDKLFTRGTKVGNWQQLDIRQPYGEELDRKGIINRMAYGR